MLFSLILALSPTQAPVQKAEPVQKHSAVQKDSVAVRRPLRKGLRTVNPFKACRSGSCG